MQKFPASSGWRWIKQGFAIFRKKPAELSTLFLAYMFLMLALGIVPVLGQVLPLILVPVFAIAFMQACINIENDQRVYPTLLLTGFRSPAIKSLLMLGVLYLLAAVAAIGISSVVDGGALWRAMVIRDTTTAAEIQDSNMSLAMVFAALVYLPAAMAFWFAAPLLVWQKMPLAKALFYSFFAVVGAGRAFLLYAMAWISLGVIVPALISTLVALLIGSISVTVFILLPLSIILTVIMYCSFYPTYTEIFGKPALLDVEV
ncbi:MAG: hypothetical protein JWP38_2061 [Herbaspirillum sp.]|jgi:hypothetical protein|nr:hypothetical protein [Herbaspirillum sp.]